MSTEAQIAANRANAQLSSGPTSAAGKAKVSLNAVKTGLTGRAILLPAEEAAQYEDLMVSYQKLYQTVGPEETALLQSIVDTVWRLDRIPALEAALVSIGEREFFAKHPEEADSDPATIEMTIRLASQKDFGNLQLQESRLVRRRDKETAELRRLQQERKATQAKSLDKAAQACLLARHRNQPFDLAAFGFEISNQIFAAHLATLTPSRKQQLLQEALEGEVETLQVAA